MKNTLLISAAAAALLAGLDLASAQSPMPQQPMQQQQPAASPQGGPALSVEQKGSAEADAKAKQQPAQASGKAKTETSAQGTAAKPQEQNKGAQSKPSSDSASSKTSGSSTTSAQGQSSGTAAPAAQGQTGASSSGASGSASSSGSASINLTVEQKNRVRDTVIRSSSAPRLSNADFSITIGTVVPRRVRFAALPPMLIQIHPAWRGYQYFLVGDQIVVVNPRTLRIVAILEV